MELAKKVKLNPVSFGNLGIFTSTMKLQRHIAKEQFKKYIEIMYKEKWLIKLFIEIYLNNFLLLIICNI